MKFCIGYAPKSLEEYERLKGVADCLRIRVCENYAETPREWTFFVLQKEKYDRDLRVYGSWHRWNRTGWDKGNHTFNGIGEEEVNNIEAMIGCMKYAKAINDNEYDAVSESIPREVTELSTPIRVGNLTMNEEGNVIYANVVSQVATDGIMAYVQQQGTTIRL